MPATLVLKNANIITMDPAKPAARVVAIVGDKIIRLVGDDGDLASVAGPGSRVIDCAGRTVVPGFNDAHCHIFSLIRKLLSLDLEPSMVRSIAEVKATIHRKAAQTPPGTWISGTGLNEFYLAEKRLPTRWEIDEAAPDHPVVVSHRSLHACVLNTLALSLADISTETPEPPGGMIDRDLNTGEPNGILYEMLGYIREKVMPPMSEDEMNTSVAEANRYYLSRGITSLQDATVTADLARWRDLQKLKESGRLQSRITMMAGFRNWREFKEAGLAPGYGDEWLRLGAVKVMLTEARGRLRPEQAELNRLALEIHRAGYQLAFHAVERNTIEAAITALEHANARRPAAGRRHRLEHGSECPPDLLARLARLGVVVASQPPFIYHSGERYLATTPAERLPWLYRFRAMLNAGITVAAGSDSPIVDANPLVGMYAAVTRKAATGQEILCEESLTPRQALAMYSVNAAYASFEENLKGSIAPGKLADLVVLSDDPTRVPAEAIKDITVKMTIIGGRVVWGQERDPSLC